MKQIFFPALFVLVLTSCQSKADALQKVCDAPFARDVHDAPIYDRVKMAAQKIDSDVSNSEVRNLFKSMAIMDAKERTSALKKEVEAAGISKCGMLDLYNELDNVEQQ